MARSLALSHLVRAEDSTWFGVWGLFHLRSAFQPIFSFSNGKLSIYAFEGLIRPSRDGELLSPAAFFSTFTALERFHVETLTRNLHLLNAAQCLSETSSIFVNFDPAVFVETAMAETALRDMRLVLHEAKIDPQRIVCEVTENRVASDEKFAELVKALRDHGFRIAVDDYGADDSDMSRVQELSPDIVKFDAIWITRLMETGAGIALLRAMVGEFEQRGISTLFEGLEEPWHVEVAASCGVSMVQGYALGRPQTVPANFETFDMPGIAETAVEPDVNEETVEHERLVAVGGRARRVFGRRIRKHR
ncbi:MAG: EAL domain-containing protein [Rhizobiaceae bacterium]|nr:EAL domain-containing protein [Rhizobiaceae bacterium]